MAVQTSGADTLHSNAALRKGTALRSCTSGAPLGVHCHSVELLEHRFETSEKQNVKVQ